MIAKTMRPGVAVVVTATLIFAALSALGFLLAALPAEAAPRSAPAPAATADTLRLTIDDAVRIALGRSPDMRIAEAQLRVAGGQVVEAGSAALPQIEGSVTYTRTFDSVFRGAAEGAGDLAELFRNSPFGSVHQWDASVTGSQLIWSGGRVGAALSAARAYRRAAIAGREQASQDVARDVRRAYLEAAYASRVVAIAEASLARAHDQLRDVTLLHREGARAEYDLIRAEVDARNEEPAVVVSRNARDLALIELRRLTGLPSGLPIALESPLAFAGDLIPVPVEIAPDAGRRAVLAQADAQVEVRRQALRVERAGRWPQIRAEGSMSHQAFPADGSPARDQFRRNLTGTIRLEMPLFLGGRTFGAVQRATAELRQAEAERDRIRDLADVEVESARKEVARTLAVLAARRGTVHLASRAFRLAGARYSNGLATQLELTDARVSLQSAEVNEVQAVKEYRAALVDLERALGRPLTLESRTLDRIAAWTASDAAGPPTLSDALTGTEERP